MNNFLYMLRYSNRNCFVRYTVILVTSRDFNHITWFRNSASVSLFATLSHRTWIANDFSSSQFFQKRSKRLKLHFLKIFLQTKNFFLTHLLYAKSTFNSDRKLYKKRWCDQMRTWSFSSHWNLIHYWALTDHCREARWLLSRDCSHSLSIHWWKHEARSRADHVTEPLNPESDLIVDLPSPTSFRESYLFHPLNLGACSSLIEWDRIDTVERWIDIALTDLCHEVIQIAFTNLCHEMIQIAFTDLCHETR
jgi:hypothetical protein